MPDHRALSIKQPWAELIIRGHKNIENRTWTTSYRGVLLVHAGKTSDTEGWIHALNHDCEPAFNPSRRGVLLGTATLSDVHPATHRCCHPWGNATGYHWVLSDSVMWSEPVPFRGSLGLFRVPDAARGVRH